MLPNLVELMATDPKRSIAIIGGGLCGLSLAIALKKRSIPFKIYEARSSFVGQGTGINISPNARQAFRLIDQPLGDAVERLVTRNPPPKEDVWMHVRFGAGTTNFADGELVDEMLAPPTGSTTVRRNDLLGLLAERAGLENAAFNKKLAGFEQTESGVALTFADGSAAVAYIVVACDGIHSTARQLIRGEHPEAALPNYSGHGAYRAVLPKEAVAQAIGRELASTSNLFIGPDAYYIMYPVEGQTSVNCGFWCDGPEQWPSRDWVLPHQREAMMAAAKGWGQTVHKLLALMGEPPFFATFCHTNQALTWHAGRVVLIGDAAHSMPPHLGQGAAQAMEDAYVLAETLETLYKDTAGDDHLRVAQALQAYEDVRLPRSQKVLEGSLNAWNGWTRWYRDDLNLDDVKIYRQNWRAVFEEIWYDDLPAQATRVRERMVGDPTLPDRPSSL